ncbi:MAG TPA: 7-cyano-7-deazaguanine synthase QueC [Gammaproteobacteria bacterium]|nr:7-cyano-7-deazaguanine synthase QueC [Gammaproteobacteria bacterium]
MKKTVILLSGGLDSTTCLAIAKSQGFECYALTFNYAQKHNIELTAAKNIAASYGVKDHKIIDLPIGQFGGSALTDVAISVPDYNPAGGIPVTYVPARNTIFLAIALGWAEVLGAEDIFIGASFVDYSGYPDCRPEYFAAFQKLATLATKTGVEGTTFKIHTPILNLSKAETIQLGVTLGVDYATTITCYQADTNGLACGRCDSCELRKKGFAEAGVVDPTKYNN